MVTVKMVLLWVAAHKAMLIAMAVMLGRAVSPMLPGVESWVKTHLPRVAHACAAVDNVVKHCPNLRPAAESLFRMVTGESWAEASANQRAA